jgi:hypothetical protein
MGIKSDDCRPRWRNLCIISMLALTMVTTSVGQDTITNLAQLAQEPFNGVHSLYVPWTLWQWRGYSIDGGEPWWLDCSQLPCLDLLPVSTNLTTSLQAHGVQVVGVLLTKNVLTGETTIQTDGSTNVLLNIPPPTGYQPGARSEDRGLWSYWQQATNCPGCFGIEGEIPAPTVELRVLLADAVDYATYQSNVLAEVELEAVVSADAVRSSGDFGIQAMAMGDGGMRTMNSSDPCTITNETDAFSILNISQDSNQWTTITWQSCSDHAYLVASTDLLQGNVAWTNQAAIAPGQDWTTTWTDTNSVGIVARFYRVQRLWLGDSVGDTIPDWWREFFFGNGQTTNAQSCASCDPAGDGITNLYAYQHGLNPTNADLTAVSFVVTHPSNGSIIYP